MIKATQAIRIADVLLIGPLLLYAATKTKGGLSIALGVVGAFTIAYNGVNYYIYRKSIADGGA